MQPIRRIAEIPFRQLAPATLLSIDEQDDTPDPDFSGYGYGRVDSLWLARHDDPEPVRVRDALVLALHSRDDGQELAEDVELEFVVEEVAEDYSITVLLSDFLAVWLPQITGGERSIVLALCNAHGAVLPHPPAAGSTRVYHATGDVYAWGDWDMGILHPRLVANDWRIAG